MDLTLLIICSLLAILIAISSFLYKILKKNKFYESRFSGIIDVLQEIDKVKSEKLQLTKDLDELRESYKQKRVVFDNLLKQVAIYDEEIELAELGFYKPHFDFGTSEQYKEKIIEIRSRQKSLISQNQAIICKTEWQVHGSKTKGTSMTKKAIKLTARAFNNECDSAVASVNWNNVTRMKQRIEKAYDAINKLNEVQTIVITPEYLKLKIQELHLAYELKDKKQKEQEEQAELKRQIKEEAQLKADIEKAIKEESKYQEVLDKAKAEAEKATGSKLDELQEKIQLLNAQLEEAHAKSERALSMAQQTKAGYVYIISNIGSFGEDVFKIGMTRRLEPLDRIRELGDASVPFVFDIHALIYSNNAPAMEAELHNAFAPKRVNLVNNRKEFFKVNIKEIEEEIKRINPDVEFITKVEAREFKETEMIYVQNNLKAQKTNALNIFPEEI